MTLVKQTCLWNPVQEPAVLSSSGKVFQPCLRATTMFSMSYSMSHTATMLTASSMVIVPTLACLTWYKLCARTLLIKFLSSVAETTTHMMQIHSSSSMVRLQTISSCTISTHTWDQISLETNTKMPMDMKRWSSRFNLKLKSQWSSQNLDNSAVTPMAAAMITMALGTARNLVTTKLSSRYRRNTAFHGIRGRGAHKQMVMKTTNARTSMVTEQASN